MKLEPENESIVEYWKNSSEKPKTLIPYSAKHKNINRLHKWNLNTYAESEIYRIFAFIDELCIPFNIKRITKIKMKKFYMDEKIVSRNNIRRGLICYCVYFAYLHDGVNININDLFDLLHISPTHYNSAVKKLSKEQLFYPDNIDRYLKIIKIKMNKNELIKIYSGIYTKNIKVNKKSIILGIIYNNLQDEKLKSTFFIKFNISKSSISKILELLKI